VESVSISTVERDIIGLKLARNAQSVSKFINENEAVKFSRRMLAEISIFCDDILV
jgi:hypothetical protein